MKFILTDAGKMMESQLVAGSKPIITRIESGDTYSPNPGSLQSVINKKQLLQVESIDIVDGKSCITFLLTNLELAEEYWVKQIGIYAKQDESSAEILYLIGQDATGELVPAPEDRVVEYIYKLNLATDNAYDMSFVVNTTDFARKKQVLELERNKVSASGGDISVTVTTVEEPASAEDKYPAISGKGSTKTVLGKLLRWVKSLKMDKVTASGGDIANTNVASLQASTVQYPVPAEGDTTKVMFGKVKKFFEDIRNTATGACYIGQIVNNCVTNRADLPLSAAQGKALMDLYNVLNANSLKNTDVITQYNKLEVRNVKIQYGKMECLVDYNGKASLVFPDSYKSEDLYHCIPIPMSGVYAVRSVTNIGTNNSLVLLMDNDGKKPEYHSKIWMQYIVMGV